MLKRLWTLPLEHAPRGLALAREADRIAVWDAHWLFWTNRDGQRQATARFPEPLAAVAAAEDGSAFAAATTDGHLSWLGPDLRPRWEKVLAAPSTVLAMEPLASALAVADARGKLHLFDADGQPVRAWTCPRQAKHLAFDPQSGKLYAAADLGWLAAFDADREEPVWRDAPFVNIAAMAAAVSGNRLVLMCFSDGLRIYEDGKLVKTEVTAPPCKLLAVSPDASRMVTAGMDGTLFGFAGKGGAVFTHRPHAPPVAIALSAFGDRLYVATADKLKALDLKEAWGAAKG